MSTNNHIQKVAIVGAGGNSGEYITKALVETGRFKVTALTRAGSTSEIPTGVTKVEVNYDDTATLVDALKGQDALVITMAATAPAEQEPKLIEAAAVAGVRWILPNEFAFDTDNIELGKATHLGQKRIDIRKLIEKLGKSSWIAVATGFWYEWSLALPFAYGFDFKNRTATFYDDGTTKNNTTTWPQVGKGVAALLSLPEKPDEGTDKSQTLEAFKNDFVWLNSFNISQKEMFESALRVTGSKKDEWKIEYQPSKERYEQGVSMMKEGSRVGFGMMLYSRLMYADESGNYINQKTLTNDILALSKEDLDEATARAIKRSQEVSYPLI